MVVGYDKAGVVSEWSDDSDSTQHGAVGAATIRASDRKGCEMSSRLGVDFDWSVALIDDATGIPSSSALTVYISVFFLDSIF